MVGWPFSIKYFVFIWIVSKRHPRASPVSVVYLNPLSIDRARCILLAIPKKKKKFLKDHVKFYLSETPKLPSLISFH